MQGVNELTAAIEPFQRLHSVCWNGYIEKYGRTGWVNSAIQVYFSSKATSPLLNHIREECGTNSNLSKLRDWASEHAIEEERTL